MATPLDSCHVAAPGLLPNCLAQLPTQHAHSPCSKACPLNNVCEYARNSGPSLHGRKRVRQPAPILGSGDGMAEPLLPDDDDRRFGGYGPTSGLPAALWRGRGGGSRGRRFVTDSSGESDGDVRSTSISGGSDSGETSSEEESDAESPRGLGVTTRRQAAALAPKPTLRQVRLGVGVEIDGVMCRCRSVCLCWSAAG